MGDRLPARIKPHLRTPQPNRDSGAKGCSQAAAVAEGFFDRLKQEFCDNCDHHESIDEFRNVLDDYLS